MPILSRLQDWKGLIPGSPEEKGRNWYVHRYKVARVTCCVVNFNTPGEQVEIFSLLKLIGELPQRMEIGSEIKAWYTTQEAFVDTRLNAWWNRLKQKLIILQHVMQNGHKCSWSAILVMQSNLFSYFSSHPAGCTVHLLNFWAPVFHSRHKSSLMLFLQTPILLIKLLFTCTTYSSCYTIIVQTEPTGSSIGLRSRKMSLESFLLIGGEDIQILSFAKNLCEWPI